MTVFKIALLKLAIFPLSLLSFLALAGCELSTHASGVEDACGRSPWVEQVYQQELALFESCGASVDCLSKRLSHIEEALTIAPDDLDLHQIYQFVQKSHGPEAEERLVEEYRQRSENRGSAADFYLYARLLGDENPQRLDLLEKAARLDPSLPRIQRSLLSLYARVGDFASADQSLDHYLTLCPTRFGVYRKYAELFPSASSWRARLDAASRTLRSNPLEEVYHRLPELWSTELDLDPQNHGATHGAIRKDLEAIARLDMQGRGEEELKRWRRVQFEGFSLLGDRLSANRALEQWAKLEPCHPDVVNGRIAAWGEENPMNQALTAENIAAFHRREGKASEAWLESCPTSWRYWGIYLGSAAADPADVADREVLRRVKEARKAAHEFASGLGSEERAALATEIARALHERGLTVEVGQDWLSAEWQSLGALGRGTLDLAALFPDELEDGATPTAVGKKLLPFSLTDLDGQPRSSDDLLGKIVYLDIWSSSCIPCRNAMPKVQALHELTKQDDRFAVLTLSADASPKHAIALIRGNAYSFPVVIDSGYARSMEIEIYPTQWLVGGDLEILQDLSTAKIPYDDEWPEKIYGLMKEQARSFGGPDVGP